MYSYEKALEESTKYFNGNDLSARVFVDKYALRDNDGNILEKTPEDMHWRLAKEFARIEKGKFVEPMSADYIFKMFDRFKYIVPQGSPMYGISNPYQYVSIGNCFVIPPPLDSYLGIMHTDTEITQISCRRGGVGWDVSNLRPKNSAVKNAAKTTSGCIEFMKRFSNTIREIGQHGRRGASLQSIHVSHPDIIEFINIKKNLTEVTGSNISVKFTDKFFEALEKDGGFELKWPVDSKNPKISTKIKAREIWDAFISSAWEMAEPGAMFIDNVYKYSTTYPYREFGFYETSSNPCQPGWAKLLTRAGIRQLSQIKVGDEIWSKDGWTKVINKWSTGVKRVYKYTTTAGVFYGTENHKIVSNGSKIEAAMAESIDCLAGEYHSNIKLNNQIIMDGIVFGDGGIHKASNNLICLYIGKDDTDYFDSEISSYIIKHRPGISEEAHEIQTDIIYSELPHTYERVVPTRYLYGDKNTVCSFLRGIYSANGSVCDNRITLKSSSIDVIEGVQMMLSSIGIRSYYTTNKPSKVQFENGEYLCRQSYDLNITVDREKFVSLIGFIQGYKNEKIKILKSNRTPKTTYDIMSIDLVSEEEVFDITVDNNSHTYWTQCCNVSNCGEQYLPNYASCRLIALNLLSFVDNPFIPNAEFDWRKFKEIVGVMQRLADDMVDLELEAIDKIIEKIKSDPEPEHIKRIGLETWENIRECTIKDRRTGCGLTALGDTIAALGMRYCSNESLDFAEEMQKQFKLSAFSSSVDMAKEIGAFPLYDHELDKTSEFIKQIKNEDKDLYNRMKEFGRRNMTLLTIAPTGSVSILTQTTSGIEPVFMLEYTRRKKGNPGDTGFKSDFVDKNGDNWMEFKVFHPQYQEWLNISENKGKSPYIDSCAHEIDYMKRVELQSRLQKHIDNSISTTINLPNDITKEQVSDIYISAYKLGCKGMTIYRDGSRSGVLVKQPEIEKIPKTVAPERPKDLTCDVHHITVKGKPYFVLVGLFGGDTPYEVFAGKNGHIDKSVKKGVITRKLKPRCYKAVLDDDTEISPVTIACDENEEALTRMVSTALRHGADVKFICEQLSKVNGDMNIFAKALARALKHYITDGAISGDKCEQCGSDMIYQEGCKTCKGCGKSLCG